MSFSSFISNNIQIVDKYQIKYSKIKKIPLFSLKKSPKVEYSSQFSALIFFPYAYPSNLEEYTPVERLSRTKHYWLIPFWLNGGARLCHIQVYIVHWGTSSFPQGSDRIQTFPGKKLFAISWTIFKPTLPKNCLSKCRSKYFLLSYIQSTNTGFR